MGDTAPRGTARLAAAARGLVEVGATHLSHRRATPRARAQATTARLVEALGRLRGTPLKLAQVLCWEDGLVPGAAAEALYTACYESPPISSSRVRTIVQSELPAGAFREFDYDAFAAASLGQVHRASIGGQSTVAVKVAYPGIQAAIETDLVVLRSVARYFPNPALTRALLREVATRLEEECNYELEVEQTAWFREHLRVEGVEVPRVHRTHCTRSIITMDLLEGRHLREWLATNPSQEERDASAQRMYEAFRRSLDDLHRVHADPNPGNYLFQSDGSVGLIDFGCVKTVTPRFAELVTATTSCYLEERHAEAFQLMREMGFYGELGDREARELDRNLVRPFAELLVTPMRESRFDFGKNRGYAAACGQRFMEIVRKSTTSGIYPDLLFVNRTQYGLYRLFELIGARVELEHAA